MIAPYLKNVIQAVNLRSLTWNAVDIVDYQILFLESLRRQIHCLLYYYGGFGHACY